MKDTLEMYRNYLATLQYHQEYGDRYGDTQELIEMYEEKLQIKKVKKPKLTPKQKI